MKKYGGVDVQIHVFLTSALVEDEWSASRPGRFTPEKEPPVPLARRLGGPHIRSGWREEVQKFWPYQDSNADLSAVRPVASRYTDCRIQYFLKGLWKRFCTELTDNTADL
jgi:hypothetical protein